MTTQTVVAGGQESCRRTAWCIHVFARFGNKAMGLVPGISKFRLALLFVLVSEPACLQVLASIWAIVSDCMHAQVVSKGPRALSRGQICLSCCFAAGDCGAAFEVSDMLDWMDSCEMKSCAATATYSNVTSITPARPTSLLAQSPTGLQQQTQKARAICCQICQPDCQMARRASFSLLKEAIAVTQGTLTSFNRNSCNTLPQNQP